MRAYEDAEILAKTEINALRSAYAEYIEDKAMADKLALDKQTDDAIRAVRLQEEAGELIKEQAEYRIGKIREKQIQKEAALRAQYATDTLNGANTVINAAKGVGTGGLGGAASAFGGAAGGAGSLGKDLEGLELLKAGGGLSNALGALGTAAPVLGAFGAIASTLGGLFGKSDEERAREAAETQRRQEEQLKILELQANYQKDMLALQEAAAKTPFENLNRNLRLIDIQSQQQKLSGVDEATIERQRLAARQGAFSSILSEQGGKIAEGALFGDVQATPESLIAFMNKRAEQALAISQFNALIQGTQDPNTSINRLNAIYSLAQGYAGKIPQELFNTGMKGLQVAVDFMNPSKGVTSEDVFSAISNTRSAATGLLSEISIDTSRAESLVSVLEQSLANQQEIKNNTKRTADNTGRLTNMRENNILDLAGGGIRGFGSFFRGAFNSVDSIVNPRMPALATPSAISNSLSVASLTRSWQDRAADGIENLVKIQTEALRLLAEIALNTDAQGQVQGSMTSAQLQDIMANIRSRIV